MLKSKICYLYCKIENRVLPSEKPGFVGSISVGSYGFSCRRKTGGHALIIPDCFQSCMCWLRVNLLSHVPEHPHRLADIDPELMATLVASPDLFVMQTEFSVYVLLRQP